MYKTPISKPAYVNKEVDISLLDELSQRAGRFRLGLRLGSSVYVGNSWETIPDWWLQWNMAG